MEVSLSPYPRGTGLILGTARTGLERGRGKRLTEAERIARHEGMFGAILFNRPIRTTIRQILPGLNQIPMVANLLRSNKVTGNRGDLSIALVEGPKRI